MENERTLKTSAHPLYLALREEDVEKFNALRANGETCDFTFLDFHGLDLRGANLKGIDLSNSYFRQTDLRGLDLRTCKLEGASLRAAKVSGTYFPDQLSPEEIQASLNFGTRMRYRSKGNERLE